MIDTRIRSRKVLSLSLAVILGLLSAGNITWAGTSNDLRVATFDIDVTPPVGSFLAYDPVVNQWDLGLRARGIVLTGAGNPVVLCAVDWIGIANEGHDVFRQTLAEAAGTTRTGSWYTRYISTMHHVAIFPLRKFLKSTT